MALTVNDAWKNDATDDATTSIEGQNVQILTSADAVLGSAVVPADHFPAAVAGVATSTGSVVVSITTSGTAAKVRVFRSATGHITGTVSPSDPGAPGYDAAADFFLPRVDLVAGDSVSVDNLAVDYAA